MEINKYNINNILSENFLKRKNEVQFLNRVNEFNKNFPSSIRWSNKVYNYINKIIEQPKCVECKKGIVKYLSYNRGYRVFCSTKCSASSSETKNKKEKTSLKNYGTIHPMKNNEEFEKRKKIIESKYGVDNVSRSEEFINKRKNTFLNKYGVDHPLKNKIIRDKQKQTILNKYDVDNLSKSTSIQKIKIKNSIKKYGVESPLQSEEIKNKIKATNLKRYGIENYVESNKHKNILKDILEYNKKNKWKDELNINLDDIITLEKDFFKIKNYCENHLDGFEIEKGNFYNRIKYKIENICTICNPIGEQSSIKENELKDWLKNDLKIDNIVENDRTILNGKELDIYLPDHNLAIEFNGLYWHSDLKKPYNYHLKKTDECQSNNIQLIHIFEDEWVYKSDIIKSIIKAKLGLNTNKIFGRKTIIKEISPKDSKIFLNENHIQGNVNSSIRIGLYYENELVSLMTFGKKRIMMGSKSNENEYEIYRFCNKLNTSIIGGASKLFKYFLTKYSYNEVVSYADRRYFDGEMYLNLGFILEGTSKPNYWYIKGLERYYRFKFRKDVLIKEGYDETKTEEQIMIERGYNRIYDCGNLKFKYI